VEINLSVLGFHVFPACSKLLKYFHAVVVKWSTLDIAFYRMEIYCCSYQSLTYHPCEQ